MLVAIYSLGLETACTFDLLCTRAQVDLAGPELRLAPSMDGLWGNQRLLLLDRVTSGWTRDIPCVRNHV